VESFDAGMWCYFLTCAGFSLGVSLGDQREMGCFSEVRVEESSKQESRVIFGKDLPSALGRAVPSDGKVSRGGGRREGRMKKCNQNKEGNKKKREYQIAQSHYLSSIIQRKSSRTVKTTDQSDSRIIAVQRGKEAKFRHQF
jgi:hypothetical protein